MSTEINLDKLAREIREKRGDKGLREVAKEIGDVSASTLSRVEQGKVPDLDTFIRLCKWLNVSTDRFIIGNENNSEGTVSSSNVTDNLESLTAHLRADKILDSKTTEALDHLIRLAYQAIEQDEIEPDEE